MDAPGGLKIYIILLLAILVHLPETNAIDVNLAVSERIGGKAVLVEKDDAAGYHLFRIHWENIGSVPCDATLRIDFLNGTSVYYTSWSERHEIHTGGNAELSAAAFLPEGNYTARMRVYACNEILDIGSYNVTSGLGFNETLNSSRGLSILSVEAADGYIDVEIEADEDTGKVAVIPEKYPLGWVVSSAEMDAKKGRQKARIYYSFPVFRESYITLVAASSDGKHMARKRIFLAKPQDRSGMIALVIVLGILFICLSVMLKRRIEMGGGKRKRKESLAV